MALELKIQKTAVTESGDAMTVTDATGSYDATSNPGGYGSPNEERVNLALFLTAINKRIDGDVTLEVASYDPEVVTEFSVSLNLDGWDESTIYGLLKLDNANDLAVGELSYDFASDEIKEILTKSGAGPWTYTSQVVPESALIDDSYTVAYKTIADLYDLSQLNQCNYKANKRYFDSKSSGDRNKFIEVRSSIESINYQFLLDNPSKAQEMVESLELVCECFDGDTCNIV